MALPTGDVIGILADNLRLRGSVLPLSSRRATRWTQGLGLARGGETVLYTGQMYQLIPSIEGLVRAEQRLGDSPLARLTGVGRRINRFVNVSAFMARPSKREREEYERVPRAVVELLRDAGVEFGCLYEDDLYSGALAWDLGLDELVRAHARRVHDAVPQARRPARDHDRPAHDEHAPERVPAARRGLRRRGAELPRGARRSATGTPRRRPAARSSSTTRASSRATRTSSPSRGSCSPARGFTCSSRRTRGS